MLNNGSHKILVKTALTPFISDDEEATVRKRLPIYHDQTKPLVDFYQNEAKSGNCNFLTVDGTQAVEAVHAQLSSHLGFSLQILPY